MKRLYKKFLIIFFLLSMLKNISCSEQKNNAKIDAGTFFLVKFEISKKKLLGLGIGSIFLLSFIYWCLKKGYINKIVKLIKLKKEKETSELEKIEGENRVH